MSATAPMTVEEVRRANARALMNTECGKVQARFGVRVGLSRQLVNNYIGKTPTKNIGSDLARRIETEFGRPLGWMDRQAAAPRSAPGADILIEGLKYSSAFAGVPGMAESLVNGISVTREWLRRNVGARPSESMVIAAVSGDAMAPTLPDGTLVLVDSSVTSVTGDGIYMLASSAAKQRGESVFRRISKTLDGRLRIKGDNPPTETETHATIKAAGVLVLGRVVVALEVKRL